jgi:gluconokinase
MIVILMGVTGVGKTTVGQALAAELQWKFVDADDFHPPANVAKMHAGIPLDDADRAPWLQALHNAIVAWLQRNESVVLACSALKAAYRELLVVEPEVRLVYLKASFKVVAQHLASRHDHYMNPNLLQSQFDTLEEPTDAIVIPADQPVSQIVAQIRAALGV